MLPWAADRFAEVLQRLGTTFVKLGQHLSLRADILAPDAQEALASLQANVAPFPPIPFLFQHVQTCCGDGTCLQ
ncbi:hypothetical protein ACV333_32975, partial [Pseudomonas aeruginosa]